MHLRQPRVVAFGFVLLVAGVTLSALLLGTGIHCMDDRATPNTRVCGGSGSSMAAYAWLLLCVPGVGAVVAGTFSAPRPPRRLGPILMLLHGTLVASVAGGMYALSAADHPGFGLPATLGVLSGLLMVLAAVVRIARPAAASPATLGDPGGESSSSVMALGLALLLAAVASVPIDLHAQLACGHDLDPGPYESRSCSPTSAPAALHGWLSVGGPGVVLLVASLFPLPPRRLPLLLLGTAVATMVVEIGLLLLLAPEVGHQPSRLGLPGELALAVAALVAAGALEEVAPEDKT